MDSTLYICTWFNRAEHASAATVASIQPGISLGCGIAALACRFDDERNYDVPGASLRKQPVCAMEPHGNYELAGPGILLPRCSASTPCRRRVLREGEGAVCISHVIGRQRMGPARDRRANFVAVRSYLLIVDG